MDSKIAGTIPLHDNAQDLWLYLERRFCVANGLRVQLIKVAISECKQIENMKIDDYYSRHIDLYNELGRLKSLASCKSKKCECNLALKLTKECEE